MLSYLREGRSSAIGKVPVSLQSSERSLKKDISDYQKFIYYEKQSKAPNKNKLEFWDNKLFQLNQQHDSLVRIIEINIRPTTV